MQIRIDWTDDKATPGNKGITTTPEEEARVLDLISQVLYAPEVNLLIYNPDKGYYVNEKVPKTDIKKVTITL